MDEIEERVSTPQIFFSDTVFLDSSEGEDWFNKLFDVPSSEPLRGLGDAKDEDVQDDNRQESRDETVSGVFRVDDVPQLLQQDEGGGSRESVSPYSFHVAKRWRTRGFYHAQGIGKKARKMGDDFSTLRNMSRWKSRNGFEIPKGVDINTAWEMYCAQKK